jgi:hypothetical protein
VAWDGSASRFSDSQYESSCVLDRKVCGGQAAEMPAKSRCSLPIREPGGSVNPDALAAAAARVNQVQACPAAVSAAKARLRSAYKSAGKEPPASIAASRPPRMSFEQVRASRLREWLLAGR